MATAQATAEKTSPTQASDQRAQAWDLDNDRVLVLYSPNGDAIAQRFGVYVCPDERNFRSARYMAFYKQGRIDHLYQITAPPQSNVSAQEHEALQALEALGEVDANKKYRVFPLQQVQALAPVQNDLVSAKTGRSYHYSFGQPRYTSYGSITQAASTSALQDNGGKLKQPLNKEYIRDLKERKLPVPEDEAERIEALHAYNILDTSPEQEFDNLTQVASYICGTSIAAISLIDKERQWFKSTVGLDAQETSREVSFCQYTIVDEDNYLEVSNANEDERFKNNPLVTEDPNISFYAGAALQDAEGHNLGSLCVIDTKPHELSESQRQSLRALAREVMNRLEMRKTNMKLAETNERLNDTLNELRETQGQLEEAQASMNHSINYASRIQRAILPRAEQFQEHFPDSFIWNEPRDGVSGDFYWMHPYRNKTILTVADCTGHGVPGAFMSLIGVNALNDIVAQRGIIEPGTILEELDSQVNQTWNSATEEEAPNDGMDITVCVLDPERGRLQYGAAMRRFYLVRGGEVHKLDGERKAVGGGDEKTFESYTTALQRGDRLYLFSDGIEDQFGGPEMQKFTPRRFRELLLEVQDRPMGQQKAAIQEALRAWQGDLAQTDDILLLGVEI